MYVITTGNEIFKTDSIVEAVKIYESITAAAVINLWVNNTCIVLEDKKEK